MNKKIKTIHLLILLTSVLSIILIQQVVFAQWVEPSSSPGGTSIDYNFVLNPVLEDIDLGGHYFIDDSIAPSLTPGYKKGIVHVKIDSQDKSGIYIENSTNNTAATFKGNISVEGNIDVIGEVNSNSSKRGYWTSNGDDIYYNDGNVGLGIDKPGYRLHIIDDNSTAVFNIDNEGADLWTGTRLARDGQENWFIGMNDKDDNLLFRADGTSDRMILDKYGNLVLDGGIRIGDSSGNQYMQIDSSDSVPPSSDCTSSHKGRMILADNTRLYICSFNDINKEYIWYYTDLISSIK